MIHFELLRHFHNSATSRFCQSKYTSFSREASTLIGLSLSMNCFDISAFGPALLAGANCILRIIKRHVSLKPDQTAKHEPLHLLYLVKVKDPTQRHLKMRV